MKTIEFRELIELFLNTSIHQIKEEYETPNINFVFSEDGFNLFNDIIKNPFTASDGWTLNAKIEDIEFIRNHSNDLDIPTIYVNNSIKFFQYLTDIVNSQIRLNEEYGQKSLERNLTMNILRRIWLRMGIDDISNVNMFLNKQLQFLNNRILDSHFEEKIGTFNGYDVIKQTILNATWDESTRSMVFTIKGDNSGYTLPRILFDIDDDNICYIYAIQNSNREKDKTIERKLYSLNKNIDNPNVHPNKVYSMILFINELRKKGITKIKIPSLQVLSYRYHELLSERSKLELEKKEKEIKEFPYLKYLQNNYKYTIEWYNRIYEKQDKISYLKTEELINLAYRLLEHDSNIEIISDLNIQGDYLDIKLK